MKTIFMVLSLLLAGSVQADKPDGFKIIQANLKDKKADPGQVSAAFEGLLNSIRSKGEAPAVGKECEAAFFKLLKMSDIFEYGKPTDIMNFGSSALTIYQKTHDRDAIRGFYAKLEKFTTGPTMKKAGKLRLQPLTMYLHTMMLGYYNQDEIYDAQVRALLAVEFPESVVSLPDYKDYLYLKLRVSRHIGQYEKAETYLQQFGARQADLKDYSGSCYYYVEKMHLLWAKGNIEESISLADEVWAHVKDSQNQECRFMTTLIKVRGLADLGKIPDAVRNLKLLEDLDAVQQDPWSNWSNAILKAGVLVHSDEKEKALPLLMTREKYFLENFLTDREFLLFFGTKMISAIYSKDKAEFLTSSEEIKKRLIATRNRPAMGPYYKAWMEIGRHALLGVPLNQAKFDGQLKELTKIRGPKFSQQTELRAAASAKW